MQFLEISRIQNLEISRLCILEISRHRIVEVYEYVKQMEQAINIAQTHCAKMEMNEEKTSKFQFHFPVLLVP